MSETLLVDHLTRFLSDDGYSVRLEVPNMGQSADVVATKNRWVMFVEAKLDNWRRALAQCTAHEQVADYVCIAIGSVSVSDDLKREAAARGYGVIHWSPKGGVCAWVLEPKRNVDVWKPQRERLARDLRRIPRER
jgi:hypothetical protein